LTPALADHSGQGVAGGADQLPPSGITQEEAVRGGESETWRMAGLADKLPNVDFVMSMGLPADVD